ncbi:hypothetical protein Trydic_g1386 [Trypoxylus dichotomus]
MRATMAAGRVLCYCLCSGAQSSGSDSTCTVMRYYHHRQRKVRSWNPNQHPVKRLWLRGQDSWQSPNDCLVGHYEDHGLDAHGYDGFHRWAFVTAAGTKTYVKNCRDCANIFEVVKIVSNGQAALRAPQAFKVDSEMVLGCHKRLQQLAKCYAKVLPEQCSRFEALEDPSVGQLKVVYGLPSPYMPAALMIIGPNVC